MLEKINGLYLIVRMSQQSLELSKIELRIYIMKE